MVSFRFVSHPKEEAAKDAQERIHGTASRGYTNKVGDHEAGMEAQASCFIINLRKKQDTADKLLSPLDNFGSEECSLARKLCQRTGGAYVDNQNWHSTIPTGLTGMP